jgi:hypothetical protein
MNEQAALAFVERHGIVLMSAHGPVPTLADAIAGEAVRGSWWGHPKAHQIFRVLCAVSDSDQVVRCRLVAGKVTVIHRRLWPAIVRLADRLPKRALAAIREEHTDRGSHRTVATAFPRWVPGDVLREARLLSVDEAISQVGPDLLKQIGAPRPQPAQRLRAKRASRRATGLKVSTS